MRRSFLVLLVWLSALGCIFMTSKPTRVVFFGDSITEIGEGPSGYLMQLREMISSAGMADKFEIIGSGIGGNKVYDLYLRMDTDVLARTPDEVVIFIGVNDVWHKHTLGTGTDPDKFVRFYDALITRLQAKGIQVMLATPALIGEKTDCSNELDGDLNHYAQMIRDLASKYHLPLVDLRKEFQKTLQEKNTANADKGILTVDGVHFSPEGNRLAAQLFLQALTGKH